MPQRKKANGNFSEEKLRDALLYSQDILDRASIPFVVLGNIAYQMRNNIPLSDYKIVLGILQRHAVQECTSLLQIIDPSIEKLTDGYKLLFNGEVPVYFKVLTEYRNVLDLLANPDICFYFVDAFKIPNPFEKYWKGDHFDI